MTRVFVYGSLKEGGWSHHLLEGQIFCGYAFMDGLRMISLDSYPGVVKGEGRIDGEMHEVDDNTLAALDRLESNGSYYTREIMGTECGNSVWVYVLPDSYEEITNMHRVVYINNHHHSWDVQEGQR